MTSPTFKQKFGASADQPSFSGYAIDWKKQNPSQTIFQPWMDVPTDRRLNRLDWDDFGGRRSGSPPTQTGSQQQQPNFIDWKKQNPSQTLSDYANEYGFQPWMAVVDDFGGRWSGSPPTQTGSQQQQPNSVSDPFHTPGHSPSEYMSWEDYYKNSGYNAAPTGDAEHSLRHFYNLPWQWQFAAGKTQGDISQQQVNPYTTAQWPTNNLQTALTGAPQQTQQSPSILNSAFQVDKELSRQYGRPMYSLNGTPWAGNYTGKSAQNRAIPDPSVYANQQTVGQFQQGGTLYDLYGNGAYGMSGQQTGTAPGTGTTQNVYTAGLAGGTTGAGSGYNTNFIQPQGVYSNEDTAKEAGRQLAAAQRSAVSAVRPTSTGGFGAGSKGIQSLGQQQAANAIGTGLQNAANTYLGDNATNAATRLLAQTQRFQDTANQGSNQLALENINSDYNYQMQNMLLSAILGLLPQTQTSSLSLQKLMNSY